MTTPPAPTPDPQDDPTVVPDPIAGAADQGHPDAELALPFKLEDIGDDFTLTGEEARQFLVTRQAQMQAGLTRKSQELAAERAAVASLAELNTALDSDDPEVWRPAMAELLARKQYVLPEDDETPDPDPDPEPDDPRDATIAELKAWKDQQEQAALTAAQQREESDAKATFDQHVVTEMQRISEETFRQKDVTKLPEDVVSDIVMHALNAPRLANGLPDFDAGLAKHLAVEEARHQRYLESKQVPHVAGGGSSGVPAPTPLKDMNDRMKRADAVASRHYTS